MDNKERLGVELYLDDKGFTNAVKKAQQSTQNLTKSANAVTPAMAGVDRSMSSAVNSVQGIANATKKAESELSKLKRTGSNIKVKIDAKDEATSKVQKIKSELNTFKGKVYTATVNVKQNMAGAMSTAGNKLSGAMLGTTMQMAGMAGIGFGIFDAVKGYADFEEEMSAVKAISGATADEFQKLNEKAIQMGADTKFSALESAQAFKYMGMAGWKTNEMIGGIAGIMNLAAASGEDLAMTSDIVTDSLSAFGLQAKDSAMFADVLAAAATNSNTNVALMGQTLKMEGLPSILSAAALAVGGIGTFKIGKGAYSLFKGLKGGGGAGTGTGADSTVGDMTVQALNVTVNASNMTGMGSSGPIVEGGGKGAKPKSGGRFGKLKSGASKLGNGLTKIGGKIAVPLALAMGAYDIATSDDKVRAGVGLGGSLAGGLAGAKLGAMGGAALGSIAPGVGTAVGGAIGGLVGGIGGAIFGEEVAQQIYDGITSNLEGLTDWFSQKWNDIVATCAPVINTIAGIFGFAWDGIVAIFGPAVDWFIGNVWEPISSAASSMWEAIKGFFSEAWESIKGVWNGVAGWFEENVWSPIKSAASGVFSTIGSALSAVQARGAQATGIPGHATGTNHFGGGWTEINERGGEIVDLPNGSRIYPHATTEKMIADSLSGNNSVNQYSISGNTFVVREEADIDRIAHSLFSMLESAEVNYGGV